MTFGKILSLETAAAVAGTAIVTVLVDIAKISPYWLLLFLPLLGAIVTISLARERFGVFRSGVVGYRDAFPVKDGRRYWEQATQEIAYWGITGATIQEDLRALLHEDRGHNRRYRFLLMSPTGEAMREQIAFRHSFPIKGRSVDQESRISEEIAVELQRFQSTVAVLKAAHAYTARPGRIEDQGVRRIPSVVDVSD